MWTVLGRVFFCYFNLIIFAVSTRFHAAGFEFRQWANGLKIRGQFVAPSLFIETGSLNWGVFFRFVFLFFTRLQAMKWMTVGVVIVLDTFRIYSQNSVSRFSIFFHIQLTFKCTCHAKTSFLN